MTTIQNKAHEPHRAPQRRGHRRTLGARARRDPRAGARHARRARRGLHPPRHRRPARARARRPRRAALLAVPAGVARRNGGAVDREDPREHGDRPQRHARPVGLDARPEDPLDDVGVGQRLARRRCGSTRTTSCTTRTRTSSAGTTTSATASCASTRTSAGSRATSPSRCGTSINMCFFEYGIAAYDLEVGKYLAGRKDKDQFWAEARVVLAKIRSQATRDYVVHPLLSGPSACTTLAANADRQPRAQRVDALGHHVRPLPRGRRDLLEDLDRGRDPRRVVPAPDARLGQHRRAARCCTS